MAVKSKPEGYRSVTPYLIVDDAPAALEFYAKVLGAVERMRLDWDEGRVGHAELEIGDSVVMLSSEFPDMDVLAPATIGGTPVSLMVYVDDVDRVFARAAEQGAEVLRPVADQFYGDRAGKIRDPFGHEWTLATHVEDIAPEELSRRQEAILSGSGEM